MKLRPKLFFQYSMRQYAFYEATYLVTQCCQNLLILSVTIVAIFDNFGVKLVKIFHHDKSGQNGACLVGNSHELSLLITNNSPPFCNLTFKISLNFAQFYPQIGLIMYTWVSLQEINMTRCLMPALSGEVLISVFDVLTLPLVHRSTPQYHILKTPLSLTLVYKPHTFMISRLDKTIWEI